jgi:C1A family cysteine protease
MGLLQSTIANYDGLACNGKYSVSYGWKRDSPDERDHYHTFSYDTHSVPNVDLRQKCSPVYDQGKLGSCTANGIAFLYQYDEYRQSNTNMFMPSRLYIYYNEREMEGTVNQDAGAEIRDGIKSINKLGVCDELLWPYDISKFTNKPSVNCYNEGKKCKTVEYKRIEQSLFQLKKALESGFPVTFGFMVYESFESEEVANTGIMPYPKKDEKILGGHCVAAVGYNDEDETFIVRNSWGNEWGDSGYFYMPYKFLVNSSMASDFWIVKSVTDPNSLE